MVNKLLLLFLIVSCGKDVNIDMNKLANAPKQAALTAQKEGVLHRGDPDKIEHDGKQLTVSKYSSYLSLQFIKTIPVGQKISIKFEGEIQDSDVVLKTIENN